MLNEATHFGIAAHYFQQSLRAEIENLDDRNIRMFFGDSRRCPHGLIEHCQSSTRNWSSNNSEII